MADHQTSQGNARDLPTYTRRIYVHSFRASRGDAPDTTVHRILAVNGTVQTQDNEKDEAGRREETPHRARQTGVLFSADHSFFRPFILIVKWRVDLGPRHYSTAEPRMLNLE